MKLVVGGQGTDGRSQVVTITEVAELDEPSGFASVPIWSTQELPPTVPQRPREVAVPEFDLAAVGTAVSMYAQMGPGYETPMHRTHTLDIVVIAAGSAVLRFEDGSVSLAVGDTVVLPGVVHQFVAGPGGVVMAGTAIGIDAPDPDAPRGATVTDEVLGG